MGYKKWTGITAVLAIAIILVSLLPGLIAAAPDNQGDEFILGFMENTFSGDSTQLFLTGGTTTTAAVTASGFGPTNYPITPGSITTVTLPNSIRATGSGTKQSRGILITAPVEITVYGLNKGPATTDAYLGLPTDILSTEYIVGSFNNFGSSLQGELIVVGTVDGTQVTIKPTVPTVGGTDVGAITAGSSVTFTLNRMQTIQFQASGSSSDLTGTEITSDKPVAVLSGHKCANVPVGVSSCDHMVEQMPPTDTWGKSFVTVPLATRTGGDIFRVVASKDSTTVKINGTLVATLNRGEFHQADLASSSYNEITTSEPALVLQYSKGQSADSVTSDPFMMIVPPTGQFGSNYTVGTPSTGFTSHYINIAVETGKESGLRLDGSPIIATSTSIGSSGYSGVQVLVTAGTHTVSHISPIEPFGVYSYGWGSADSYGYPGGLRLAPIALPCSTSTTVPGDGIDNDCDGRIDEELANGIDDDDDALIDEDLATPLEPANVPGLTTAGLVGLGVGLMVVFFWISRRRGSKVPS